MAGRTPETTGTTGASHKVWLHIGMPKTGTTAVQRALYRNRRLLAKRGYFYPDFGHFQHVALVRQLAQQAGSTVSFPKVGDCGTHERFLDLVDAQRKRPHTSIVSSEYFFQRVAFFPGRTEIDDEAFAVLARTIDETAKYFSGCDVTVVAWLRRQDNWLMSMYNQTVKGSLYAGDFATFARHCGGADLLRIVGLWTAKFGRQHVICRSYDAAASAKVDLVEDFLATACPDVAAGDLKKAQTTRNLSLGNEALWLKLRINTLFKARDAAPTRALGKKIRQLVADVTRAVPDSRQKLVSNAERRALMGLYLDGNRKLAAEYPELRPLAEVADLSADSDAADPAQAFASCEQIVDQMIGRLVLDAPLQGEEA
jgi:hypothetical protein